MEARSGRGAAEELAETRRVAEPRDLAVHDVLRGCRTTDKGVRPVEDPLALGVTVTIFEGEHDYWHGLHHRRAVVLLLDDEQRALHLPSQRRRSMNGLGQSTLDASIRVKMEFSEEADASPHLYVVAGVIYARDGLLVTTGYAVVDNSIGRVAHDSSLLELPRMAIRPDI